jgi:uncharacterized membrane protein required for colicin V production
MTWLDIVLVLIALSFLALGARLGSVWMAACFIGGFFGAFVADVYGIPLSGFMGGFAGSEKIAVVILFALGLGLVLLPGYLLSRITSKIFLGLFDTFFGLMAGGVAGLCAVATILVVLVAKVPKVEAAPYWRQSHVARPLHQRVEDAFNNRHLRRRSLSQSLKDSAVDALTPMAENATEKVKDAADSLKDSIVEKLKK